MPGVLPKDPKIVAPEKTLRQAPGFVEKVPESASVQPKWIRQHVQGDENEHSSASPWACSHLAVHGLQWAWEPRLPVP